MTTVLIVIHLMVVLAMIGLVLLQRSEGGALGIGGGGGAFMTGRSAANVLTRATGVLAIAFFATSLGLAILARLASTPADILDAPGTAPVESSLPAAPIVGGAPESAEDLLDALGGAGPQEAPAASPDAAAPAAAAPTTGDPAPAAGDTPPAAPAPAPAQ